MPSHHLHLSRDGRLFPAAAGSSPGPVDGGALVFEVTGCPDTVTTETLQTLAQGFVPPAGSYRVPYDRLVARRNGGCCGGACGG